VTIEYRALDFSHAGDARLRHREMTAPGAGVCVIFHRSTFDEKTQDLARLAIAAAVPTCLIEDERAMPRRLAPGSGLLA
jgi:hypothetical protein